MRPAILLSILGLASAVPSSPGLHRREDDDDKKAMKVLIGAPNKVIVADFDGKAFGKIIHKDYSGTPSWMLFKEPHTVYAVDESKEKLRFFDFNPENNSFGETREETSASGVVHLAFNKNQTRMVGSGYGEGVIDVWDVSTSSPKRLEPLKADNELGPIESRQDQSHPHQAVLDPTGKFFAVNDLGTDTILVIDAQDDDKYSITNNHRVQAACGPRNGVFYGKNDKNEASHYIVVCELSNLVLVYTLKYTEDTIEFTYAQTTSTFAPNYPPKNMTSAAAGAVVYNEDNEQIYVANRNTGYSEDIVARFGVTRGQVDFVGNDSSKADNPRMMSLSLDRSHLFVANVDGGKGLHAFSFKDNGALDVAGHADLTGWLDEGKDNGPLFVTEVPTS